MSEQGSRRARAIRPIAAQFLLNFKKSVGKSIPRLFRANIRPPRVKNDSQF